MTQSPEKERHRSENNIKMDLRKYVLGFYLSAVYLTTMFQLHSLWSVEWQNECKWRIVKDVEGNAPGLFKDEQDKNNFRQDSHSSGLESIPWPPKYEVRVVATQPPYSDLG